MALKQGSQQTGRTKMLVYRSSVSLTKLLQRFFLLALLFACVTQSAWARDVYSWSKNLEVDPPTGSRQQEETSLATDSKGRVWLSFIDDEYHQLPNKTWVAWPRKLRLFMSENTGQHFKSQPDITEMGGNLALAADGNGAVYASYVQYTHDEKRMLRQRIALKNLLTGQEPNEECLPWDNNTRHDQSNLTIGKTGGIHVIGLDIAHSLKERRPTLLYARSTDGGKTFTGQQRLDGIGQLPQTTDLESGLLIAGPTGYYFSEDHGISFPSKMTRRFADKLVRVAVSPDRRTAYVIGDSKAGGLYVHVTSDGVTWRMTRVDDAPQATAWRYPAIHVDDRGRIHIVWIDDRTGYGALYHAYSDDGGTSFSPSTCVSDRPFLFPADYPPPPPATQNGTWIGDYLSLTTVGDKVIVAWSDQRRRTPKSVVYVAVGKIQSR